MTVGEATDRVGGCADGAAGGADHRVGGPFGGGGVPVAWSWWREFDRRKGYEAWGCISCAYWLSWHCGLDLRSARDKVRVGACARGPASDPGEVRGGEDQLLEGAGDHPGGDAGDRGGLGDVGGALRRARSWSGSSARTGGASISKKSGAGCGIGTRARRRRSSGTTTAPGCCTRRSRPKTRTVVKKASKAAREELSTEDGSAEPSAPGPTVGAGVGGDGGIVPRERAGGAQGPVPGDDPRRRARRSHDDTDGRCELDDGPALSPDTARRIACDTPFVAVLVDKSGQADEGGQENPGDPHPGEAGGTGP